MSQQTENGCLSEVVNSTNSARGQLIVGVNPYLSIRDFAKQYSTWTESSIRWLIYNNTAGFNDIVVRRVGKSKILLSVTDFWGWIELQNRSEKVSA